MRGTLFWMAAGLVAAAGCGAPESSTKAGAISGSVVYNNQPTDVAMVIAVGPDGQETAGPVENGRYTIEEPPPGKLRFKILAAPLGVVPTKGDKPLARVPAKYLTINANNDLSFEYAGGQQTYDIVLKP